MGTYYNILPQSQAPFSGKLPRKPHNQEVRTREYLTGREVQQLMAAARKTGRHGHRDATLIQMAYRHGLRVSELVALRWDQVDLTQGCCTSIGPRMDHPAPTPSEARRYAP